MQLDLTAAGRALEFLGALSNNLITLHASFLLGFIATVALLRRRRRGSWDDIAYVSFVVGLTAVLFLSIVFLGLTLDLAEWPELALGVAAAVLAWAIALGLPARVRGVVTRAAVRVRVAGTGVAFRLRRPRIPDQLPGEFRSIARH